MTRTNKQDLTLERLEKANEFLKNFYTVEEAAEEVRKKFPGYHFSQKQITRAIEHGNIQCQVVGRTRYIPQDELNAYMLRLQPTANNPSKLRHRRNSRKN